MANPWDPPTPANPTPALAGFGNPWDGNHTKPQALPRAVVDSRALSTPFEHDTDLIGGEVPKSWVDSDITKTKMKGGVDVDTGLPLAVSKDPSLGFTEGNSITRTQKIIGNLAAYYKGRKLPFDPSSDVRKSPYDNTLEYLNPETKRWTSTGYPIGAALGDAVPLAASTAGAIGGTMSPLGFAGGIAGAGLGEATGEYLRRKIGTAAGVRPGTEGVNDVQESAKEGLTAAEFQAAMDVGLGVYKYGKYRLTKTGPINPEWAARVAGAYDRNREFIDSINDLKSQTNPVTGAPIGDYRPSIGEATGDQLALRLQNSISNSPAFAMRSADTQANNRTILSNIWDNINYGKDAGPSTAIERADRTGSLHDVGDNVKRNLTADDSAELDALEKRAAQADLANANEEYARTTNNIRTTLLPQQAKAKQVAMASDTAFKAKLGEAPVNIPVDDTFNKIWSGISDKTRALAGISPEAGYMSVQDINQAITDLGTKARKASNGTLGLPADVTEIIKLRGALKDMRNTQLEQLNPDLYQAQTERDEAWNNYNRLWTRNFMGTILNKNADGYYKLAGQKAFAALRGQGVDPAIWDEAVGLLKQNPQAMQQLKEMYMSYYGSEVANAKGIVDPAKHAKFMKDNQQALSSIFSPEDISKLNGYADLGDMVIQHGKVLNDLTASFKQRFGIAPGSITPRSIVQKFFDQDPRNFEDVYKAAANIDAQTGSNLVDGIKDVIRDKLYARSINPSTGTPTLARLAAATNSNYYKNIVTTFGQEYGDNLVKATGLARQLDAPRGIGSVVNEASNSSLPTKVIRIISGVMTPEGRAITALSGLKDARYADFIHEILYNPDKLRNFAQAAKNSRMFDRLVQVYPPAAKAFNDNTSFDNGKAVSGQSNPNQ